MIGFLATALIGAGVSKKLATPLVYLGLVLSAVGLFFGAKALYDSGVISKHEAKQEAVTAKADKKADNHAAEQRRKDDARTVTEAQEIKEAVNEAGPSPIARRNAYYSCVSAQQAARRERKPPANC